MDWKAKVELYEEIRREYENGAGTIKGVAEKFGVHRRMVRDAIRNALPAQRKKIEREPARLVGDVVRLIHTILEQDQQAPRKQRHTGQRIYERISEELPEQTSLSAPDAREGYRRAEPPATLEKKPRRGRMIGITALVVGGIVAGTYYSYKSGLFGGGGNCRVPSDRAADGSRCGGRAASVR